jgi:hypothetical protein
MSGFVVWELGGDGMKNLVLALAILIAGCATPTKPNPVYKGPLPDKFSSLEQKNPLLAKELCKLPELQDGVSPAELSVLEEIVELYNRNPSAFDETFKKMYQVGLPEVRKYCSPLQALFWLAEDEKLSKKNIILRDYGITVLLNQAWVFRTHPGLPPCVTDKIEDEDIDKIIAGITDEEEKKIFEDLRQTKKKGVVSSIWIAYTKWKHKDIFSEESKKIIEKRLAVSVRKEEEKQKRRWKDFDIVTDRLNAPELVDYYERKRFSYHFEGAASAGGPSIAFKNNGGACINITTFTVYCLVKGGYKASDRRVQSPYGGTPYHVACLFEWNGKKYIMDNGRPFPFGIVSLEIYSPRGRHLPTKY